MGYIIGFQVIDYRLWAEPTLCIGQCLYLLELKCVYLGLVDEIPNRIEHQVRVLHGHKVRHFAKLFDR